MKLIFKTSEQKLFDTIKYYSEWRKYFCWYPVVVYTNNEFRIYWLTTLYRRFHFDDRYNGGLMWVFCEEKEDVFLKELVKDDKELKNETIHSIINWFDSMPYQSAADDYNCKDRSKILTSKQYFKKKRVN